MVAKSNPAINEEALAQELAKAHPKAERDGILATIAYVERMKAKGKDRSFFEHMVSEAKKGGNVDQIRGAEIALDCFNLIARMPAAEKPEEIAADVPKFELRRENESEKAPITVGQVKCRNTEGGYMVVAVSPHARAIFGDTAGGMEDEIRYYSTHREPSLFGQPGIPPITKFYRLTKSGRSCYVVTRSVDNGRDSVGRHGAIFAWAYVIDEKDFPKLGNNPFRVIRMPGLESKRDDNSVDVQLQPSMGIVSKEAVETLFSPKKEEAELARKDLLELARCLKADKFTVMVTRRDELKELEMLFEVLPPSERARLTFSTFVDELYKADEFRLQSVDLRFLYPHYENRLYPDPMPKDLMWVRLHEGPKGNLYPEKETPLSTVLGYMLSRSDSAAAFVRGVEKFSGIYEANVRGAPQRSYNFDDYCTFWREVHSEPHHGAEWIVRNSPIISATLSSDAGHALGLESFKNMLGDIASSWQPERAPEEKRNLREVASHILQSLSERRSREDVAVISDFKANLVSKHAESDVMGPIKLQRDMAGAVEFYSNPQLVASQPPPKKALNK